MGGQNDQLELTEKRKCPDSCHQTDLEHHYLLQQPVQGFDCCHFQTFQKRPPLREQGPVLPGLGQAVGGPASHGQNVQWQLAVVVVMVAELLALEVTLQMLVLRCKKQPLEPPRAEACEERRQPLEAHSDA